MIYIDAIKKRKSTRTYSKEDIPAKKYDSIIEMINSSKDIKTPFESIPEMHLIRREKNDEDLKLGTYGFIKNPSAFLLGATRNTRKYLIDFGFVIEKSVLELTDMGIYTCWLGGTFHRSSFVKYIKPKNDEIIPCVISLGYKKEKRLSEKLIRSLSKADKRLEKEELFSMDGNRSVADSLYDIPLEMVRIAPSASNKQPWRAIVDKDEKYCHFYLKKTSGYAGNKLGFEMQSIDMGIALCHFQLTCNEIGISGEYVFEQPAIRSDNMEYIVSWKKGE